MKVYPFLRELLFMLTAEDAHHATMKSLKWATATPGLRQFFDGQVEGEEKLARTVAGITFPNPIGLAAGFDKNALYINEMSKMGFGFIEIGTVTPKPQSGNPKPRLFRLAADHAIVNRMGFNNDGANVIAERLKAYRNVIIGGNIGKNKVTPNEEALQDYLYCYQKLYPYVHYFVVNVSSPNTPGLRELQGREALTHLLQGVQALNRKAIQPKPVFLKIAPDLTYSQLDEVIETATDARLDGIIATNTTISRDGLRSDSKVIQAIGQGGLSGAPLTERSFEILNYLRKRLPDSFALISSGGIMSPQEAVRRLDAGAQLVQLYTGFIYEGPGLIKETKKRLLENIQ